MAGCAVALASCTQTDVLEEGVQSSAIGFENAVSKESRALTNTSLNKFYVYGYYTQAGLEGNPVSVFDGEPVSLADGSWGYTNTRYWVPGATYYFYAYSCENNAVTNASAGLDLEGDNVAERALTIDGYTANSSHQHDLIFATNDNGIIGKDTDNAKVAFTFKHILSRVNVKFTSEFAAGYDIVVKDVKLENIVDKGNFDPAGTTWSGFSRTVEQTETEATQILLSVPADGNVASKAIPASEGVEGVAEKTVTTGNGYVIPVQYQNSHVRLVFDIEVKQGNDVMLARTLSGSWQPKWVAGMGYTYNVKISGDAANLDPIVFETSENMNLDGWNTGNTDAVEMNFNFSAN